MIGGRGRPAAVVPVDAVGRGLVGEAAESGVSVADAGDGRGPDVAGPEAGPGGRETGPDEDPAGRET